MLVRMRYIVEKRNRNGASRWYWQRPGFPTKRLPDDEVDRLKALSALNERADAEKRGEGRPAEPAFGSIAWAVEEYRKSPKFTGKAAATRRLYERYMLSLAETVGRHPIKALTPQRVHEIIDGIDSKGGKVHCAAVLRRVADVAIRRGLSPSADCSLRNAHEVGDRPKADEPFAVCVARRGRHQSTH